MRPVRGATASMMLLLAALAGGSAFVVPQHTQASIRQRPTAHRSNCRQLFQLSAIASTDEDCGCGGANVSGAPSEAARALDPRVAIGQSSLFTLNGEETNMNQLIGETGTSLVVFLRSLGWPFCQEQILQYNKRRDELLAAGVKLVIVSIGLPEKGKALCEHLGVQDGESFVFVDPSNSLYSDLDLNKSVGRTFLNPATPLAFKDRLFRDGKMFSSELSEVLSKWKDAFYIPPKQDQAFNQGGSFIFDGDRTVYAHYDEATAAHALPDEMVDKALATARQ